MKLFRYDRTSVITGRGTFFCENDLKCPLEDKDRRLREMRLREMLWMFEWGGWQ